MDRFATAVLRTAIILGASSPAWPQSAVLNVTLTGQSMIRSDLRTTAPTLIPGLQSLLKGDVVFTNFEGTVAQAGQSVHEGRGFLAPPEALAALQAVGFNLLAFSDNHAFDLKVDGIQNTIREADRLGIVHAGTGTDSAEAAAPAYLRLSNTTIALVASASGLIAPGGAASSQGPGVNELRINAGDTVNEGTADLPPDAPPNTPNPDDAKRILQSIREAKKHADLVVVYQHNHVFGKSSFSTLFSEGMPERMAPNEWLKRWTHAEVDAGADIVVMHGAPLLHGVEIFHGRPIFYDLGNFIYNLPATLTYIDEPIAWESVVAQLEYHDKVLKAIHFRPVVLNEIGAGQPDVHDPYASNQFLYTRGLPSVATGAKARYILQRLAELSAAFGTKVEITGESAQIKLSP